MAFAAVIAAAEPWGEGLRVPVPADWHQGRTAYGGFSAALALEIARRIGGDLPPLRSTQVSMIGPLSGTVELRARELRRGRNAIWIAAEIAGESGVGIAATFVFMGPVESALHLNESTLPATLIAPDDARPFVNERGPAFLRHHFDVRFALPRSAEKRPELCWWVRPRERDGLAPLTQLVLSADALPPAVMPLIAPQVPVSTMQWQLNLLDSVPTTSDGWWLLRSVGDYAEQGCSSQRMEIWNVAGEPMAAGLQSIALFG